MPAVSKAQQKAAGMALAAKRGELPVSALKGAAKQMYDSMTERQLEDYAATARKGLPGRKGRGDRWALARKTTDYRSANLH